MHITVVSGIILKETGFNLKEPAAVPSTQKRICDTGVNELSYHVQSQACQQPSQPTATASPSTQPQNAVLKGLRANKPQGSWRTRESSYWLLTVSSLQTVSRISYIINYHKFENIV